MQNSKQIVTNINEKTEKKNLNKLQKNVLLNTLKSIEFNIYERYDVCCVDNEICKCCGNIIYNNYLNINKINCDENNSNKLDKKNSLFCGNDYGNSFNINVKNYICKNIGDSENGILLQLQSSFVYKTFIN